MKLHQFTIALEAVRTFYGLDDWTMCVGEAGPEDRKRMETTGEIALCLPDGNAKHVIFTYHPQLFDAWLRRTKKEQPLAGVAVHEWGHVVLNPWPVSGQFDMGGAREECHANHLEYAFRMVPQLQPRWTDDVDALIDKAYKICHLDENNWIVHKHFGPVEFEGERLPAFARSLWAEEEGTSYGWGALAARQIEFWLDVEYAVEELGLALKDVILREFWRVVLNPDGKPHRNNVTEQKLDRIMHLMHARGW